MKINFANKRFILFLMLTGFLWAFLINEANISYIRKINPDNSRGAVGSTTFGYTTWSPDDQSYTTQIKNYLEGKDFNVDPNNPELSVRRSPGYPIFFGIHYAIWGEPNTYFVIRYTQILIHLLALVLLGQAIYNLSSNSNWAKVTAFLYAINPFTISYLYSTMTESLSPSYVIFVVFAFSICYKKATSLNYFLLGTITAISSLHRPFLGLLLPSLTLALLFNNLRVFKSFSLIRQQIYLFASLFLGVALIFSPWVIRNYFSTNGDIVFLEKYYYGDQMDYGRGHEKFRQWVGHWTNPANFLPETYSNLVRFSYREGNIENVSVITNKFVGDMPDTLFQINSKEDVYDALASLNNCYAEKEAVRKTNPDLTLKEKYDLFNCESVVSQKFENLGNEYRHKVPLNYYVIVPFKTLLSLIFQSGSYAYPVLNPPNREFNFLIIATKGAMYLLNVALFLGFIIFCIAGFRNYPSFVILCSVFIITKLGYLIFINRYSEARYLIPIYPMFYASFAFCLIFLFQKIKRYKEVK